MKISVKGRRTLSIAVAFVLVASLLAPLLPAFAAEGNGDRPVLSVTAGSDGISLLNRTDMERIGPQSFFVADNGEIFICDTLDSKLKVYKNGSFLEDIRVDYGTGLIDVFVTPENNIYLLDESRSIFVLDRKGNLLNTYDVPQAEDTAIYIEDNTYYMDPSSVRVEAGSIYVTFKDGSEYRLDDGALTKSDPYGYAAELKDNKPAVVNRATGIKTKVDTVADAVEVSVAKKDRNGRVYVKTGDMLYTGNTSILEEVVKVIDGDKISAYAQLRENNFFRPNKDLCITEDGSIYQMVVSSGGIDIYSIGKKPTLNSKIAAYKNGAAAAEPMFEAETADGGFAVAASYPYLNKDSVLAYCQKLANLKWTYNSSLNGDNLADVTLPDYLRGLSGTYTITGEPYCWAGWDNDVQFKADMANSYVAGNVDCDGSYVSGTSGVDCSGYVSVCYSLGFKHGTYTLVQSGGPFGAISKSSVGYMDILDNPGSHVVVVYSVNKSGSTVLGYNCYEATVSGQDRAQFRYRTASELSSYGAYRYKYWNASLPSLPNPAYSKADYSAAYSLGTGNTGTKTVEFDITPQADNFDAYVGYSDTSTTITSYTSCAMLIYLQANGTFAVRNGAATGADAVVSYTSGTKYHVRMVTNLSTKKYDVYVTPGGGTETRIAYQYAFRSDAPATDDLGKISLKDISGNQYLLENHTITIPPLPSPAYSRADYTALYSLGTGNTGVKTAEFDIIPLIDETDSFVGYADTSTTVTDFADFAMLIYLQSDGTFGVRNGATISSMASVPYTANNTYHVSMTANLSAKTYDVYVTPPGGSQIMIANDYAFRSDAPATDDLGKIGLKDVVGNAFRLENHVISSGAVQPVYSAGFVSTTLPEQLTAGQIYTANLVFANTGNQAWNSSTKIGTSGPRDMESPFYNPADWSSSSRPTALDTASAAPGTNGTFTFTVKAPSAPGSYTQAFELLQEGVTWFEGSGDDYVWDVTVVEPISAPGAVIDDTLGSPGFTKTGTWETAPTGGYQDLGYQYASAGAADTAGVWNINIPAAGSYKISAMYRAADNRATSARFIVKQGTTTLGTVSVNQTADNEVWVTLGTYSFTAGAASVVLDATASAPADSTVAADAVKYERVIIIDNGGTGYSTTGSWANSASGGYNNGTYQYATVGIASTAVWNPGLPAAGNWKVSVIYKAGTNRATSAKFTTATASGTQTTYVNQTQNSLTWVPLGTWNCNEGGGAVTLYATGSAPSSAVVIADAVMFEYQVP